MDTNRDSDLIPHFHKSTNLLHKDKDKPEGIEDFLNSPIIQRGCHRKYSINYQNEDISECKEENNFQDKVEWNSRGNTNFKNSQQLYVRKNELYLSRTSCTKNSKKETLYSRRKKGKNYQQITMNKYLSETKNIKGEKISSQYSTNSPPTHNSDSNTTNETNCVVSSSVNNKSYEDSHFNIDVALKLSSQISHAESRNIIRKRKISEYFPLKKYIHKEISSEKSYKWISLDLFEEKTIDNDSHKSITSSFNVLSKAEKFSLNHSPESGWVTRGLQSDTINCELPIPKNELYIQSNCSSNELDSSSKNKRKKRKNSLINNKKVRQSTLYDCLLKKYISMNENENFILDKGMKNDPIDTFNKEQICHEEHNEKLKKNYECYRQESREIENIESILSSQKKIVNNIGQFSILSDTENVRWDPHLEKDCSEIERQYLSDSGVISDINKLNPCSSQQYYTTKKEVEKNEVINSELKEFQQEAKRIKETENSAVQNGENKKNKLVFRNSEIIHKTLKTEQIFTGYKSETRLLKTLNKEQICEKINENYECHRQGLKEIENIETKLSSKKDISNNIGQFPSLSNKENVRWGSHLEKDCSETNKLNPSSPQQYYTSRKEGKKNESELKESREVHKIIRETQISGVENDEQQKKEPETKLLDNSIAASYNLLESVSSPIIKDLECQEYLRDLVISRQKLKPSILSEDITNCVDIHAGNQGGSEDFLHFWENTLSQTQEDYSQNVLSPGILNTSKNISRRSRPNTQDGSEVFQYILSQDCANSDSLMDNALKNMNNLSQKIAEKRSSIFDSNNNANKLLEIALKIYAQYKERSILSKAQTSVHQRFSKFGITKKFEGRVCIYRIIKNRDVVPDELDKNEKARLWNDDFSKTSISESDLKILSGLREICENKSYLYDEPSDGPCISVRTGDDVESRIRGIFEQVLNDLNEQKFPCLEIRRQTFEDCIFVNDRLELKSEENPKMIIVKYKNTSSQFKFCSMMYVFAKVLQILETNSKITRRELYYQIKHLISNQRYIDRAVQAVSYMLCVGPWDLNIVAQKGLIFGDLKIVMSSKEIIDCNLPGTLIPQDIDEIVELRSSAYFILVVEKESIFYKLLEEDLPNKLVRPFLMITGKGYPDLNTQLFLRKLWIVMTIPVFIFTDADPHGVNIMMTYRYGSLANVHLSNQLALPKAQWLGVFPSEIVKLNADKQPLTETERNLLRNLLKSPYMKINTKIEKELKLMLESGYKAGIEGIIKNNTFLSEFYFPLKFHNKDLI